MNNIAKESIQLLRNLTSCPMMQCKKALVLAEGDMEKAEQYLIKGFPHTQNPDYSMLITKLSDRISLLEKKING